MNKLIAKTALITVAVVISLSAVCASLVALFRPTSVAKSAVRMGMYRTGANFQEIAYNRRPSVENLGKLIDYAVAGKSNSLLEKYCPVMMNSTDYDAYCAYRDGNSGDGVITGSYEQYLYGNYAAALLRLRRSEDAVAAVRKVVVNSYPQNNAVQYLLYEAVDRKEAETLLSLRDYLWSLFSYLRQECPTTLSSEMTDIAKDQCVIYAFLLEEDPENEYYQDQMRFWVAQA